MVTQEQYEQAVKTFNTRLAELESTCRASGIRVRKTCGMRTDDQQRTLYSIGRTRPGRIVTDCRPGQSPHNWNLGADYAIIVNGKCDWNGNSPRWKIFGLIALDCKLTWGGLFKDIKDCPHVQLPGWKKFKR